MTARHLTLTELTLQPSGEWFPQGPEWAVIRVAEGTGYWLQRGAGRELAAGHVVVATGNTTAVLRASSLGRLSLEYYLVQPRLLNGIISATESKHLQTIEQAGGDALVFGANDNPARSFSELTASGGNSAQLIVRSRLVHIWAEAVQEAISKLGEPDEDAIRARLRLLLGGMAEAELALCSIAELAARLHCSERHFSRIFRQVLGVSFREHQTEMRLARAGQILAESNAKVIQAAYDSGYRHLGLFNTMFKKHFGMTPTEWRSQSRKPEKAGGARSLRHIVMLIGAMMLCFGGRTLAQTNDPPPPNSATAIATNAPASATTNSPAAAVTNSEPRFEVEKYDVQGNTLLDPQMVESIVGEAKGKEVTLTQIRKALGNLQTAYRERGFASVAVTLPQQQLTNATIRVQVIEAPLVAVNVINNRYYSSNNVMRALPHLEQGLYWTNFVPNSQVLQRELDLANANRDRQIYPILGPGPDPGTTELTLKVKDRLPLHGRFELNNQYTPGTPDLRMNLSVQYNNLWDLDHQIGLQNSFTPQELKSSSLHNFSFLDEPTVANYSGFYRMPLGDTASVGRQINDNPVDFGYNEVTHQFRLPPATGRPDLTFYGSRSTSDTGVKFGPTKLVAQGAFITIRSQDTGEDVTLNEGLGARVAIPLPQLGPVQGIFSFGMDLKKFRLSSFNTNNFYITTVITNSSGTQTIENTVSSGQPTRNADVNYLPMNVGLDLSVPDNGGVTFFNLSTSFNPIHPRSQTLLSDDAAFAQASYSTNARADYVTINAGLSREQMIYKGWSLLLRANGQWANGPLISNEQFGLGGVAGPRGYLDGEAYGDSGWRVQIEPRTPLINLGMVDNTAPFWVRGSVYMDYGELYREGSPGVPHVRQHYWGVGMGVTATIGDHFDAKLAFGWPLLDGQNVKRGEGHVYFSIGAQF